MSKSLFANGISFKFEPKSGKAGISYLFPGQGSMAPGVLKDLFLYDEDFQVFVSRLELFTKSKNLPSVYDYILQKNIPQETFYLIQNLALLCCEVALFQKYKRIISPSILFGHSLGEYASLVCSGFLTYEEGLELIYLREVSCPKYSPGSMTAINVRGKDISSILGLKGVSRANINSGEQIVLSHSNEVAEELYALLRKRRIPFVPLYNIKYPYHSSLMDGARKVLRLRTESLFVLSERTLEIPFYSSVTKKKYESPDQLQLDFLDIVSCQLTSEVDFVSFIQWLNEQEKMSFVECGPGQALEGFVSSISRQNIQSSYYFHKLNFEAKKKHNRNKIVSSKWFVLLNKVIGDITGYELEDIQFDKRFQEDLGIDSIKKAEILHKVFLLDGEIDPRNISLSQFKSIDEFVHFMEDKKNFSFKDQMALKALNPDFKLFSFNPKEFKGVLKNVKSHSLENSKKLKDGDFLNLIKESSSIDFENLKKEFTASHWNKKTKINFLLDINSNEAYGLSSFLKSVLKEKSCKPVFHYLSTPDEQVLADQSSGEYLYRDGKTFTIKPENYLLNTKQIEFVNKKILFVAGHTGIGKYLLEHSQVFTGNNVVVVGRSLENKVEGRIEFVKGDLTDHRFMKGLFEKHGHFDLCINAAGIQISKSLEKTSTDDFKRVKLIKLDAVKELVELLRTYGCKLFVNFSSVVSFFGNEGQYGYTYANETMRHFNSSVTGVRTLTINWPAWDKVGMTEEIGIYQKLSDNGISFLLPEEGVKYFDSLVLEDTNKNADVFVIDNKDIYLFSYNLKTRSNQGLRLIHPKSLSFTHSVSLLKYKYLKDHHMNGLEILPSSLVLGDAYKIFNEILPNNDVVAFDFFIKNMSIFKDGLLEILYKGSNSNQRMEYEVISNGVNIFQINGIVEPPTLFIDHKGLPQGKRIDMSTFYSKGVVNFGPSFRVLDHVFYDEGTEKLISIVKFEELSDVIESMFQSLTILGMFSGGGIALPVSVESLVVKKTTAYKELKIVSSLKTLNLKELVGDIGVVTDEGEMLVSMSNLKMSFITKYDKCPLRLTDN